MLEGISTTHDQAAFTNLRDERNISALELKLAATVDVILSDEELRLQLVKKARLIRTLVPYLLEYPFLARDERTVADVNDVLTRRIDVPYEVYAVGVFGCATAWIARERERRIHSILKRATAVQTNAEIPDI